MQVALVQFTVWNHSLSELNPKKGQAKAKGGKCPSPKLNPDSDWVTGIQGKREWEQEQKMETGTCKLTIIQRILYQ